ncbi:MAG: hypothetical protein L3K18_04035 [Thermoplasmata archaeon]|nr:hypothetical protein [Thermoplasmata archaeon]MCI4356300.1 hypothetical protein [Thermoplasmata archaeon]
MAEVSGLTSTTIRRTLRMGWLYLAIGTFISVLLTAILLFRSQHGGAFATTYPLELPVFAVLASTGGLQTFTSDRTKGVFEYLIAYGVRPRTLFVNGLLATMVLTGIILGIALGLGLGLASANGVALTGDLEQSLALYTVPMSFAAALFTTTVGMIWTTVSTPRTGINSPVGLAPMVGIGPTVLVLIVAETLPSSEFYPFTTGAAVAILAVVGVLLAASSRLMGRERFLSPL